MTALPEWLHHRAHLTPERLALISSAGQVTFGQLDDAVDGVAGALQANGIGPSDRVALLLQNGPVFVELVHALPRLGATMVLLNTRLTADELGWQVDDAEVTRLIHDQANAAKAAEIASGRVHLTLLATPIVGQPLGRPSAPLELDTPHTIIYTSGTTGRPKGALLTCGNHWWSAIGSALNLGLREDDRWLAVLPLFHVGGLSILLRSTIYGIAAIVHESFDPAAANRAIDEQGATIVSVVATALQRMLDERGDRPYPATLRCALLGGGPAPQSLLERAAAHGVPVVQTYGLTEAASQVATLAPGDALRKLGSAGKPLMPTELRIEGHGRPLAAAEIGEIVVRGPTVTSGYVNSPDATAQAIRDGWLHTGDLGYLDDEGYLYVVDRRDDLIVSGGENVYPAEVEAALMAHPAVREAGVIGVPDPQWGQVPLAAIVARESIALDVDDLRHFCQARLAGYKIPRRFHLVDALPRNAAGKLLRRELRVLEKDRAKSS